MSEWERFADLQKQGFMKPRKEARKPKVEKPTVACERCMDWHREGKHTRKANEIRAHVAVAEALARLA